MRGTEAGGEGETEREREREREAGRSETHQIKTAVRGGTMQEGLL